MAILFTAIFSGLEVIWDRRFGFLKEIIVAPISRTEITIGKTLEGTIIAIIQGFIVLITTYFLGLRGAIVGMSFFGVYNDLVVIGIFSVFVCAIGIRFFSKMEA